MDGMRDLLRTSLGRALREFDPVDRLAAAWPVAAGSRALAAHGTVVAYIPASATVRIEVDDPVWLDHLRSLRSQLAPTLGRIANVPVREIHFEDAAGRARRLATEGRLAVPPSPRRPTSRGRRP